MSRYHGYDAAQPTSWASYGRGARRRVRALKRLEADERNAKTPRESRKQWRRDRAQVLAAIQADRTTPPTGGTA